MAPNFFDRIIAVLNPQKYKNEVDYLESILTEYKNKRSGYEEFRTVAHKTVEAILKEDEYKYQLLSRTKTPERLKEKLLRKKELGIYYSSLQEIEDLVGLRVIFYTEQDKERFIKRIKNEIGGSMKIEDREKDAGYKATHIIMTFGPKRLKLSEYKHFNGLKSEMQITSILNHAWAEIEHDLIYKDIHGLKNRDPKKFEFMKQKMSQLVDKYIKKAAQELEEVINQSVR